MTSITLLLVLHDVIWKIKNLLLAKRELLTGSSVMTDFRRRIFYFVYLMHQINKCLGLQLGKGLIVYQFQLSLL